MRIIKLTKRQMFTNEKVLHVHIVVNDFLYVEETTSFGTIIGSLNSATNFQVQESVAEVLALIENTRL